MYYDDLLQELMADNYSRQEAINMINTGMIGASSLSPSGGATPGVNPGALSGVRAFFSKYFNKPGSKEPLFKGSVSLPSLKGLREQPVWQDGPSVGGVARTGMGLYQGAKAFKGLTENAGKDSDYNSLKNDINLSIASNPMYDMYLDAADEKRLRQMRNGSLNNGMNGALEGGMKGIPQALLSALIGGVVGGGAGAAINGIGSLVNSGIQGYGNSMDKATGELQGLYSKLRQADSEYKTMKRPTGLGRAGLSTHYFNQLY